MSPAPTNHAENQGKKLSDREFELAIKGIQRGLCGYIASITSHSSDRDDILQETNLFLWQRKNEFKSGTNFKAWAFKVAYFKAMGSRRDKVRRGEEVFSEDITQRIATGAESYFDNSPDKFPALENCLKKLKPEEYQLLQEKYFKGNTITDFSRRNKQSAGTLLKKLSRIRLRLRACIEQQLP
ncbi:sigma-70 family RNA polymerase sigma factor [Verrucomicrobiaceae bacterium N1E253]|uniref:Sigma-70 family RNA polymerase sigma factor n=1 Tax=Oceaniferula marina TaxID=2748318 RepID=A0A851GK90_9BACT|nr:sigma-70 family RNA polymerase sigma factor [Oceaniferula marina]NWK57432.1 sigma-70 family RNA polymerase sigma factor [Oceaniferula marina]